MKYLIFILSLAALFSCKEEEIPVDIRPLIPGEYHGEISIIEFNTLTEEFDLNPNSFSVSAVIRKIDHPYDSLYEIEFSKNPADNATFRFTLYPPPCRGFPLAPWQDLEDSEKWCDSYERSAEIHVQYDRFGPCSLIPHIDLKAGGTFFIMEDSMKVTIKRYYCAEPENTFKLEFSGSQIFN